MKVLKFGGTSLKDMDVLEQVGSIVRSASEKVCVIVSATGGTTNELLHAANLAKVGDSKYLSQIQFQALYPLQQPSQVQLLRI